MAREQDQTDSLDVPIRTFTLREKEFSIRRYSRGDTDGLAETPKYSASSSGYWPRFVCTAIIAGDVDPVGITTFGIFSRESGAIYQREVR